MLGRDLPAHHFGSDFTSDSLLHCHSSEVVHHSVEDVGVEDVAGVPVEPPEESSGGEEGHLRQKRLPVFVPGFPLEPSPPGHLHLSPETE